MLFLLFGISAFLAFGDQLVLGLGLSQQATVVISGLMGGMLVFGMAYQGGRSLAFIANCITNDPARNSRISAVQDAIGRSAEDRVPVMADLDIKTVVLNTEYLMAFTVRCGSGNWVFLSTSIMDKLSDTGLRGLLAHEYGHIRCGHPLKIASVLGLIATVKMAFGVPFGASVVLLLSYLYLLRTWEFAADAAAVRSGEGNALLTGLEEFRLFGQDKEASGLMEFFYGHPNLSRRLSAIRANSV